MAMTTPNPSGSEATQAVGEVRRAITGLVTELSGLRTDVETKLQQTEKRLTMLDRKSHIAARPPLSTANDTAAPHQKAFENYLRSGDDAGLRGIDLDAKSMNTTVNADGGFLVDPVTSVAVSRLMTGTASLRAIASVVTVEASAYDVLVDHSEMGAGWASETATMAETSTPQIDRISIPLNELSAQPKTSQRLLDDAAFDIENWLATRIAEKFARTEAEAFVAGDGVDKPTGFLTHTAVDNDSWSWGNIGYVVTGVDGDMADGDPVLDLIYSLGAEYRANGTFVMNSKTAGMMRKLKDADGRFLWSDGLAAGEPARLLGYPVLVNEDMPDVGSGSHSIAFGDFRAGYTIAERPDLRVLRDPFSAKPHVLFYAAKRVGGDVTDFAAIKLLKFATS
jgi:HK97 family phage major capsid protein